MRTLLAIVLAAALGGLIWLGVDGTAAQARRLQSVAIEKGTVLQRTGNSTVVMTRQNGVKATVNCTCDQGTGTCTLKTTTDSAYCTNVGGTCKDSCSMSVSTTGLKGRAGSLGGAVGPLAPSVGTQ